MLFRSSVFFHLKNMQAEIDAVSQKIENGDGDLNELVLQQTHLIELFEREGGLTYKSRARSALLGLGFSESEFDKATGTLSGGQMSKLSLCKLLLSKANLLLLDEPTNHLDTSSREALEKTLLSYGGTMLIISHDRYFINKLATRILYMDKDGFKEYLGNYDNYLEHTQNEVKAELSVSENKSQAKEKLNDYQLQKQLKAQERKRRTQLKNCEEKIALLEEEIESLSAQMNDESIMSDYEKLSKITEELEEKQSELENQYELWAELSEDE